MTVPATLVIGSRGLLGGSVAAAVERRGPGRLIVQSVRWNDPERVHEDLAAGLDRLLTAADGESWRVAWCAGVGVTSTSRPDLEGEVEVLRRFLSTVAERGASPTTGRGAVFLASSAGGVYAGSADPPFTEHTLPCPLSPYGEAKLLAERAVSEMCPPAGVSALIGRVANLYGPGQDVRKPQGLITHLCRGHVTGQPISVYVSLDTLRDYLFVRDCAEMVLDGFDRLERERSERPDQGTGTVVTKILASQRSVSVGALLMESRRVFRRPPLVLVAASPFASAQARDLRLRSVVWRELDQRVLTTLPAGISATVADIEGRILAGQGV
jgi:UDP-glucose 4-epimerase